MGVTICSFLGFRSSWMLVVTQPQRIACCSRVAGATVGEGMKEHLVGTLLNRICCTCLRLVNGQKYFFRQIFKVIVLTDDGGGAAVSTATKVVKSSPARPQKSSKGTDSPGRARKGSGVTRAMARIGQSVKKVFKHEKTDYLARLTRHLLKEDDGDHWPAELDFELVENNRIELELNKASLAVLHRSVAHAKVITYSSVVLDGAGRSAQRTRIDGRTVVLVPYSAPLVGVVHAWMQKVGAGRSTSLPSYILKPCSAPSAFGGRVLAVCAVPQVDMYTGFGVQPPTLEQEQHAQAMMAADDDCHSFVVCSKVNVGDERCPVHPEGRAQIVLLDSGVAQVHVGLVQPDVDLRAFMHREVLLILFMYIRQTLPVHTVSMLAATTVRPKPGASARGCESAWITTLFGNRAARCAHHCCKASSGGCPCRFVRCEQDTHLTAPCDILPGARRRRRVVVASPRV
eukprot:m.271038 g.271038  ORF g.271038 m.271038 type:complete len:457 (-) comp19744_c0_seq26:68-1438(-)